VVNRQLCAEFVGFGVWGKQGRVDGTLITRMRDQMTHRGPDDEGQLVFDSGRGGFGFRRLSIIDLSPAGHQPMHGCTDRVWVVFNGEIYNHLQLRKGLEQRGHRYTHIGYRDNHSSL